MLLCKQGKGNHYSISQSNKCFFLYSLWNTNTPETHCVRSTGLKEYARELLEIWTSALPTASGTNRSINGAQPSSKWKHTSQERRGELLFLSGYCTHNKFDQWYLLLELLIIDDGDRWRWEVQFTKSELFLKNPMILFTYMKLLFFIIPTIWGISKLKLGN